MTNKAKELLLPNEEVIFRVCFLYVGQGDATLLTIPTDEGYKFMLIDCNVDKKAGGIELARLVKDLTDGTLDYFVNTHPHMDHLCGLKELSEEVEIKEVWHSGHIPGKQHYGYYEDLKNVMDELGEDKVVALCGTREVQELGNVHYNVLSPAEYVNDEINDEEPDERRRRIHENCAVLRFTYGEDEKHILITGDADLDAFKNHITDYHKDRLFSHVLSAVHHGSRTFFKAKKEDEPYRDHIEVIKPEYLIVSAPTEEESKHDHPHTDAMDLYKEYIDEDGIFHLGANRECVIVDINEAGDFDLRVDKELVEEYGFKDEDNDDNKSEGINKSYAGVYVSTKLDNKPMGGSQ
ncbi:ComEC/Rec2 family competence protein [Aneurinibacillus aneurinilyticus]|uniref:ComEC/Rec2 family competence protein n=1 Tax=Aneurinibacillus aneurinilyticus TaxID=1391 RepID=UPI0003F8BD27|nr:MBL fold metallo-hydrolase [Aneurinibacillus aneurinilyticus]MED0708834.1 MBL fold metallo-hydrolase [Aneurinibacillus aneurinilyticus]MED0726108.1 MBL fold metallo-hydrolase [Aneurinibacillus aneurinilyticus]MED0741084.1 MBL fold metallo-hydrolase [Aneurinibacillus aneurinilyticus]